MTPWEKKCIREHEQTTKRLESAGNELERIACLFGFAGGRFDRG